jgi:flagellar biosynthesis protein FlhF
MARFGENLGVPVAAALGPEDLRRTLAENEAMEHIFVDTAGRSHRDPSTVRDLQALLESAPESEILLVLSAATRSCDSREILESYSPLPWSRLVLTKLDETRTYGELYNCVVRSGRPIACVTTGQSVPEHLEALDVAGILRKALHG